MKQKAKFRSLKNSPELLIRAFHLISIALFLHSCFLTQDRTTVVYGTITDQNGQPVDSILVLVQGAKFLAYENLKQVYSDENGKYELMVEVPKKYGSANVVIPFGSSINPKYQKHFKGFKLHKNNVATNNCCFASVGQKTKYDFQLIPR